MRHHNTHRITLIALVILVLITLIALSFHYFSDRFNLHEIKPARLGLLFLIGISSAVLSMRWWYRRTQRICNEKARHGLALVLAPHPDKAINIHDLFRRFPGQYIKREKDWPCMHTAFELTGDQSLMQFSCYLTDPSLQQAAVKEMAHEWRGTQITMAGEDYGLGVVVDPVQAAQLETPTAVSWCMLHLKNPDVFPLHIPEVSRGYGLRARDQAETFLAAVNATATQFHVGLQLLVRPAPQSAINKWKSHMGRLEGRLNRRGTRSFRNAEGTSMTSQSFAPPNEHLLKEEMSAIGLRLTAEKYEVSLRIWAAGPTQSGCQQEVRRIAQNVQAETRSNLNELKRGEQGETWDPVVARQFPEKGGFLMTAAELGQLFHMPDEETLDLYAKLHVSGARVRGPGADVILSPEQVPACVLPGEKEGEPTRTYGTFSLPTGQAVYVGHPLKATKTHCLITGSTGTGKSVVAGNITHQDWAAGNAVLVIDPHGSLVDNILAAVPEGREQDVCVLDMESYQPFQFNICRIGRSQGVGKSVEYLMEALRIGEGASWDSSVGMREVLENAFLIALYGNENACLIDVAQVLDANRRKDMLAQVVSVSPEAQDALRFWKEVFPGWNKSDQNRSLNAAQRRIKAFLKTPVLRRTLASPQTTFNLADAIKERRLILAPMPETMGAGTKRVWSSLLVREFVSVMMSLPEGERPPTTLVIDELRDTIGHLADYVTKIAEQLRKFGTSGNFMTQSFERLPADVLAVLKNECRTQICFNCGPDNALIAADVMGEGVSARDIQKLTRWHAFMKLAVPGGQSSPCLVHMLEPLKPSVVRRPVGRVNTPKPPERIWQPPDKGLTLIDYGAQEVLYWVETSLTPLELAQQESKDVGQITEEILYFLNSLSRVDLAELWRLKQQLDHWIHQNLLDNPWVLPDTTKRIKRLSATEIGVPWWLSDIQYTQGRQPLGNQEKSGKEKAGKRGVH